MKLTALKRALAALRDDRTVDALDALLEAWADAPSPALAACIASASVVTRTEVAGVRGKTKSAIAAWKAAAKTPRAHQIPALLDAFADVLWRDAAERIAMMRWWRPDPRVDELCIRMFETLPYRSTSKPFYTALIDLASRIRDPASLARIVAARVAIGTLMSPTLGDWVERRVDELIEALRPAIAKVKPAVHDLRQIDALLAKATASSAPRVELGELLVAVYEDPADTARRLVYADALLERDDERGELITLQCQPSLTPVQQRRERALLKAHAIDWLGELAAVVKKDFVFERGFLADCTVDSNKGTRIKPVVGHPAWSTVHTLADSARIALDPVMRALRTLEFRPNRARQREGLDDAWRELLDGRERPLERLYFTDLDMYADHDQQLDLLRRCDALPKLRELYVGGTAAHYHDELFRSPMAARVDTLGFLFDREDVPVDDFCQGLLRHSPARRVVVRHEEMTLKLERGEESYERATFEIVRGVRQACGLIDALPASIREVVITTPEDFDRGDLVALSSAKRQWSRRQAPAARSP